MESSHQLIFDLALALAGGFVGALLARSLKLPLLVGYLVAGVVMGPFALGLIRDSGNISSISELGVNLLMFALGMELSFRGLARMKSAAAIVAPVQILLSIGLGYALGLTLGWTSQAALVLGFVLALSSTMVVVKLLTENGELHTQHGRLMVTVLLVQDLAAVLIIGLLPVLSSVGTGDYMRLSETIGMGAAFLAVIIIMAGWVAPMLMALVAKSYSKEVFVAFAALLCFGGAVTSSAFGFSLAIGAFVAGLLISESHYSQEMLASVTPLRDLFGMVFFVSMGLLFDPSQVMKHPQWALGLLAAIFLGKALIVTVATMLGKYHVRTALVSGFGLAQIGEFSFLLVVVAQQAGLIGAEISSLIIAVAGISFLASPALMAAGRVLYNKIRSSPAADAALAEFEFQRGKASLPRLERPVLLCGYGRVGSHIGEMLREEGEPFIVIEYDQEITAELRGRKIPALYGDATSHLLLKAAGAQKARLAVIVLPDAISTRLAVRELRRLNPNVPIVARVHFSDEIEVISAEGAEEVVHAEFEASLEIMRHSLLRLGRDQEDVQTRIDEIRRRRYRKLRREEET